MAWRFPRLQLRSLKWATIRDPVIVVLLAVIALNSCQTKQMAKDARDYADDAAALAGAAEEKASDAADKADEVKDTVDEIKGDVEEIAGSSTGG